MLPTILMIQRHNECLLASVCAVSGTDYLTASDLFHATYGETWYGHTVNHGWKDNYQFLEYVAPSWGILAVTWNLTATASTDLSGTGIIVIRQPVSSPAATHAMAFADGLVYDSARDIYGTLDEILSFYPGWTIHSVTRA